MSQTYNPSRGSTGSSGGSSGTGSSGAGSSGSHSSAGGSSGGSHSSSASSHGGSSSGGSSSGGSSAQGLTESLSDFSKLQEEVSSLKDSLAKYVANAGTGAATSMQSVASQVTDAYSGAMESGAAMASNAAQHAKTFASEIESTARKNPLGAMAGALFVGVLIGLMGRRS